MNILVIFTGGTIGSVIGDDCISTQDIANYRLINMYRDYTGDNSTNFTFLSPYSVLSENISATEINTLRSCIDNSYFKGFDGIIITHGTDTLQYTAAALAYTFPDCKFPIILVSSDYPLEQEKSNGVDNFSVAVSFIKRKIGAGVFVSYKNDDEDLVNIHSATRITNHKEASGNIYSIDNKPFAIGDALSGVVRANPEYKKSQTGIPLGIAPFVESPEILMINSHPADNYAYSLENYKAIILAPYHSGTLNTANEGFKAFCKKASEKNIPIFVTNVAEGISYESSKSFNELNLIVLPFCTTISAYVKCWAVISLGKDIKEFMLKPIAEEFSN